MIFAISTTVYALPNMIVGKQEVVNSFLNEVKQTPISEEERLLFTAYIENSRPEEKLTSSQFFVATDRNPAKQNAALVFWDNNRKRVEVIGFTKVSTGSVRPKHFYTPIGWFENVVEHGSYRAEGTKNENGIRGYGKKGMRVWDFGWIPSTSGYKKGLNIDIRFQMHATDPDVMESRLGRPDSQGCLRIHQTFNKFLDQYGIIDKNYEAVNYWALSKTRTPALDAGSWVMVFDTSK